MRFSSAATVVVLSALLSGCGYVHFGRSPKYLRNDQLERAYSDLSTEQKMLKQELSLAHRQTDALRAALTRVSDANSIASTQQLNETTRELTALRASYARLQQEKSAPAAAAPSDDRLAETQQKLAASTEAYAHLQQENNQLQHDLDAARAENTALSQKLQSSLAAAKSAQAAAADLSTELATQRAARARAEQALTALRAQLDAVVARNGPANSAPSSPTDSSAPLPDTGSRANLTGASLAALQYAKAPPSDPAAVVELRTNVSGPRARDGSRSGSARATTAATDSVAAAPTSRSSPGTVPAPAPTVASDRAAGAPPNAPAVPMIKLPGAPASAEPASAPTPSATPQPSSSTPAGQTYTVEPGDTLEKIATKVYGGAGQWAKIYAANSDALSAGGGLKPGMVLQIPPKE